MGLNLMRSPHCSAVFNHVTQHQHQSYPAVRLSHKLLGYVSKVAPKIFKSFPKVAHFTKKLLKSCFLSTPKNQFLLLMKVNLCTSIPIIFLFIYSFLLTDISIPTEMIFDRIFISRVFRAGSHFFA